MQETARIALPAPKAADLEALFALHGASIRRWAVRLGGPDIDADDVVQEVYLVAARRKLDSEQPGVKTWLFRTTNLVVRSLQRRQRWRRWIGLDSPADESPALRSLDNPSENVLRYERARILYRLLDRLPRKQRDAVVLFEVEGLATNEIASLCGTKVETVRVHIHRARAALAKMIGHLSEAERDVLERPGGNK